MAKDELDGRVGLGFSGITDEISPDYYPCGIEKRNGFGVAAADRLTRLLSFLCCLCLYKP